MDEILKRKSDLDLSRKRDDSDIPDIIDQLKEEQRREIIEYWIKDQRDKKEKRTFMTFKPLPISLKARVLNIHRTTFLNIGLKENIDLII